MLIGVEGEKIGLISTKEALKSAKNLNLDLVQVSPTGAIPVVCKLLDYGKHLLIKRKISQHQSKKLKGTQQKKLNLDLPLIQETIILN